MPDWGGLAIVFATLLIMELVVEQRFRLRGRLLERLVMRRCGRRTRWPGLFILVPGLLAAVTAMDAALLSRWPELEGDALYKYAKLAFIVHFLPKRGDWTERDEANANQGPT